MDEDTAGIFLEDAIERVKPLIDDLAKQIGESPEAWRGVATVINGLSIIMADVVETGFDNQAQMIVMAVIIAAIDAHPARKAAEQHWNLP